MSRHRLTSLRRHSLSGGDKGSVWDLYATNGFLRPITNTNSSVKWVEDLDGTLVQSPANKPAMPGMRLTDGVWYPTASDGSLISPISRMIRTAQGSVAEYDETYPGVLVEPAGTNKCTCRKVNPTDTTGITNAGGGVVSIAYAPVGSIAASGLSGICTSGKVYKVTLSSAGGVIINGAVASTNPHALSAYVMTEGEVMVKCRLDNQDAGTFAASTDKFTRMSTFVTPSATGQKLYLYSNNSSGVFYFIMPELVESAFLTSPIMPKPTEDGLSTVTRPANPFSFATPARLLQRPNDFAVIQTVIPKQVPTASNYFFSLYASGTDFMTICQNVGTNNVVRMIVKVANINKAVLTATTSITIGLPLQYIAIKSSILGCFLAARTFDGTDWSAWSAWTAITTNNAKADITAPVACNVGTTSGMSGYFYATFPMTRILRIPTNLSAEALQAWLVAKAGV